MKLGFDTQARLYLDILRAGDLPEDEGALQQAVAAAERAGVVYFNMNDQITLASLAEGIVFRGSSVVIIEGPVHEQGMERIEAALKEARKGIIRLNRAGETQRLEKETGINPKYILETSPLPTLFLRPDEEVTP